MTILPFALREPTIHAFRAGIVLRLRRPADGLYRQVYPGDALWIREPYRLQRKFAGLSPTAANNMGARPHFAADLARGDVERLELGEQQPARCLLRHWHRSHAIVRAVTREPLHALSETDTLAEGFASRAAWIARWDADIAAFTSKNDSRIWRNNPTVLVIELEPVLEPHPAYRTCSAPIERPPQDLGAAIETAGGWPQ